MKKIIITLVITVCAGLAATGASWHVTVDGSPSGNGTPANPWDLNTALNKTSVINGGDTLWIHPGTYLGAYKSTLRGSASAPVIVKAVSEFDVILDGNVASNNEVLAIEGQYVWYIGLTITNSNTHRNRVEGGTSPVNTKDGVYFIGANNKLINCIIHNNGGNGIGFWSPAINSEIYGCIIYHNGYRGTTRGHGHGIYTQNAQGTKLITDNIFFNSFGIGIHAYTEGGSIQGFKIEGNAFFNSGLPGADFLERHIIAGGLRPVDRTEVTNNYFYFRPNYPAKAGVQFGYLSANLNAEFTNNYMVDGSFYIVRNWNSVRFTGNSIISSTTAMQLMDIDRNSNIANPSLNHNKYYKGALNGRTFEQWKNDTNQDNNSLYYSSEPSETVYFIRKNLYEEGRAHLVIYNWENLSHVPVDFSDVLSHGDKYKLFDVSRLSQGPLMSGVYTGSPVSVSMAPGEVDLPNGYLSLPDWRQFVHTGTRFGVFMVKSNGGDDGGEVIGREILYTNPLKARIHNGLLHVTGLSVGETLSIYNAVGMLVNRSVAISDEIHIPLSVQGIYIVQAENHIIKVIF